MRNFITTRHSTATLEVVVGCKLYWSLFWYAGCDVAAKGIEQPHHRDGVLANNTRIINNTKKKKVDIHFGVNWGAGFVLLRLCCDDDDVSGVVLVVVVTMVWELAAVFVLLFLHWRLVEKRDCKVRPVLAYLFFALLFEFYIKYVFT